MPAVMELAMEACAVTNPFCPEAIGSRWPDNSYTKSIGWSITANPFPLATDANGSAAILLFGDLSSQYNSGTVTGTGAAYGATNSTFISGPTAAGRYRVTSWGVRVHCTSTMMNTQGMCRIRLFSPIGGVSLGATSVTSITADAMYDVPVVSLINKPLNIIPSPLGINAREFRDYAASTLTLANWINPGWQVVQVAIVGGQVSTTALQLEYYANYEIIPPDGDATTMFAQPPPVDSPVVRQANASVLERIGNFVEGAATKVDAVAKSSALKYVAAAAGAAVAGPAGAAAGYSMVLGAQGMRRPQYPRRPAIMAD